MKETNMGPNDETPPGQTTEPESPAPTRPFGADNQLDFEIRFFGDILQRNPNYVEVLRVMGNNLSARGDYAGSLEIDRRIAKLCPTDKAAHYNLACSYSLMGMIDSGLKSLQKAIDLGYHDFTYIQGDRDLETLRRDPRFHDLLARHAGLAKPA